jgi:Superinfection immunity protein
MPLIIAALYKLPHQGQIAVLSLALGWTGAGWLAALVIAVGGAIRATRPALAGQALPEGMPAAGAYAGAMPKAPPQSAWPGAAATAPERTQSPQWAPSPERTQSPHWAPSPERAESPQRAQPPEPSQRTQPPEPAQGPPPPSWPDNPR